VIEIVLSETGEVTEVDGKQTDATERVAAFVKIEHKGMGEEYQNRQNRDAIIYDGSIFFPCEKSGAADADAAEPEKWYSESSELIISDAPVIKTPIRNTSPSRNTWQPSQVGGASGAIVALPRNT
jgi:hypothetical protein